MPNEISPEEIRRASFRTVLRGLDANDVTSFLNAVADELDRVNQDRQRLEARLGEFADRDLRSEFDQIGREVSAVLEAAREAAESMRERASLDAARWRSEATAEAEEVRKNALNDAEALRGDAWTTGTELLSQTMSEIKRSNQEAERETLSITGEAEREAHRLVSSARREAEDLVRGASMDAEKITADAVKRRDDFIEQAHRQAAAAEERTRALEERREELLEELENVRATLSRLEGTLEDRREDLDLAKEPSGSVRIIPGTGTREREAWELGETVRVVPGELPELKPPVVVIPAPTKQRPPPLEPEPSEPSGLEPESPEPADPEPPQPLEPEPLAEGAPVAVGSDEAGPRQVSSPVDRPAPSARTRGEDEVGALFASLRGQEPIEASAATRPTTAVEQPKPQLEATASDEEKVWLEDRDSRLLPITNRGLRGVKKAVTDAQNVALDNLRTDTDWLPDQGTLADDVRADLIGMWAEAYSAGHTAAEEMLGRRLKRPPTPPSDAADVFGEALSEAINDALIAAGDSQRERQSATSRVFRAWRTDEAERRLRALGHTAYHRGLAGSAPGSSIHWVAAGTPCSACQRAAANPAETLPPVHPGCECTILLV